jgi:hypothetical protein
MTLTLADPAFLGRSQGWTPAAIGSALALWLDADDASTITLNGSTVSQWDDKSGNNRNVVQATAANQPPYTASGINSLGSLDITTAPRWLTYLEAGTVTSATIAAVAQYANTLDTSRAASFSTATGVDRQSLAPASDGSLRYDGAFFAGSATPTTAFVRVSTRTPTQAIDWRNGATAITTTPPVDPIARNFNVGNGMPLNFLAIGTFTGKIGEVVGSHTALSTDDRQKLEGYLAWKWGLEANLPGDHPYKNAPPTV